MDRNEILQRLLENVPDSYEKGEGSFFYDALMPVAIELEGKYAQQDTLLESGFALTASGEYLEKKVFEQGLVRKAATYATGTIKFYGADMTAVLAGTKVASDNLIFTTTEDILITEAGFKVAGIVCDAPGSGGNIPAGSIKYMPVTIAGLSNIVQETATSGGYDAETDEELRQRYFDKMTKPATSGNKWDYANWAMEVSGVGAAKVLPLWDGPGTVKVIIIDKDKAAAPLELVNEVEEHIEDNRPVGAEVTVVSAEVLPINVSVTVVLETGTTLEIATPKIEAAIEGYLKSIAFEQSYVSYAHIGGAILNVGGISDYEDLTINDTAANIDFAETVIPVLGVVTIA